MIAVIALLISMLLPALSKSRQITKQLKCGTQLGQIASLVSQYGSDYKDLFPPHRSPGYNNNDADWWWGTLIYTNYTDTGLLTATQAMKDAHHQLFHCPILVGQRQDYNTKWTWSYTAHKVGYGYNAFWLGFSPYNMADSKGVDAWWAKRDGRDLRTKPSFQIAQVQSPSRCLFTGETNPKPDGKWSSTLWFPYIEATNEGVNIRHFDTGNVVFVDCHYESRKNDQINNSIKFRALWDPTLR